MYIYSKAKLILFREFQLVVSKASKINTSDLKSETNTFFFILTSEFDQSFHTSE
jgi:hypothetical protein